MTDLVSPSLATSGRLISVVDGDTCHLDIMIAPEPYNIWALDQRCRLARINAPELRTASGPAARDYLAGLLAGGLARVSIYPHLDNYGRPLVELTLIDGRNANDVMVQDGYAVSYP